MTAPFDFINGDDYAEPTLADVGDFAVRQVMADVNQKHAALVTAFEALAAEFGRDGSHYHRDRVLAVLKEHTS